MTHQPHDHRTTTWGKHAMPELNDLNEDSPAKLSRRNVVVGTAWAVPAIMVVGAAPAFADSKIVKASAKMVKKKFTFTVETSGAGASTVTITSITPDTGASALNWSQDPRQQSTNILNHTATILGHTSTNDHPSPVTYTVNYTVTVPNGPSLTDFTTFTW